MTCKVFGSGDSLRPWTHLGQVCSLEPGPCPEVGHNAVQSDANEAHKEKGTQMVRAVSCFSGSVIITVQFKSMALINNSFTLF